MSNNKYKILVIEDEANIRSFIDTILESNGYQPLSASTCAEGKLMFASHRPDLVILDLGLPDADGTEFIQYARQLSTAAIIVLSARSTEDDKIQALDLGANDYITKPFGTGELMARVRACLRTSRHSSRLGVLPGGKFCVGDLEIDYDQRMVTINGSDIHLTQTEYNIVALLSENCGKMMTYAAIIKAIWGGCAQEGSIKKLQVNMANIRKKFGDKPGEQNYIANEQKMQRPNQTSQKFFYYR